MFIQILLMIIGLFLGQGVTYAINPSLTTFFAIVFLLFACGLSFRSAAAFLGWKKSVLLFLSLSLFALSFETLALQTGIPYGSFRYTGLIGTTLPGGAAWTIPLGWIPLVLTAVYIGQNRKYPWSLLSALLTLCLCDLLLDPVATALGYWQWEHSAFSYYDVPLQNFFGWLISGIMGIFIARFFLRHPPASRFPPSIMNGGILLISFHLGAALRLKQFFPVLTGVFLLATFLLLMTKKSKIASPLP